MDNNDDAEYQEYLQWKESQINSARQGALQKAGPAPFQPGVSEDKTKLDSGKLTNDMESRIPSAVKSAIGDASSLITGRAKGLVGFFGGKELVKPLEDAGTAPNKPMEGVGETAGSPATMAGMATVGASAPGLASFLGKALSNPLVKVGLGSALGHGAVNGLGHLFGKGQ